MISVIVPVYNMEKYLDECVSSICKQTYRDIEIILVDDGSKDNSLEKCREWAEKDSRISVYHKENGGQGSARNLGISCAKGEYIGFIDSDDIIMDNTYEVLLQTMENFDADICVSKTMSFNGDCPELISSPANLQYTTYNSHDAIYARFCQDSPISDSPCNKLYKKEIFNELRFLENRLLEDTAFMYRAFDKAGKIVFVDSVGYCIRCNLTSISRRKYNTKRCDTILTYEEMAEFFSMNSKYSDLIGLAQCAANGAVFYNAGEMCIAGVRDEETRKLIQEKAKAQLKEYKFIPLKNRLLLRLIACHMGIYGLLYKMKKGTK